MMDDWSFCPRCGLDSLPLGWKAASDENGNVYYVDVINSKSQWEVPTRPVANHPQHGQLMRSGKGKKVLKSNLPDLTNDTRTKYSLQRLVTDKLRLKTAGGAFTRKKPVDPNVIGQYEKFQQRSNWGCFLAENINEFKEGQKIWMWVCTFMKERKGKDDLAVIRDLSLFCATKKKSIRDEIFVVLMKQLTNNQGPDGAVEAGWKLFDAMLRRFPPSLGMQLYVFVFLAKAQETAERSSAIHTYTAWCLASLSALWGLGEFTLVEYSLVYFDQWTRYKFTKTFIDPADLLTYGKALRQPLQKLNPTYRNPVQNIWKHLNQGIALDNPDHAVQHMNSVCQQFRGRLELTDEVFCLCLKQLCFPPTEAIGVCVAKIIDGFLGYHMPSKRFGKYMHTQLLLSSKSQTTGERTKQVLLAALEALESHPELLAIDDDVDVAAPTGPVPNSNKPANVRMEIARAAKAERLEQEEREKRGLD